MLIAKTIRVMEESSYKLYERLLRLGSDWQVVNIEIDDPHDVIHVTVSYRHKDWRDKSTGEIFPKTKRAMVKGINTSVY